jgi:two-component system, cell cycle sensor histidine kinase and response regulator CckA
VLDVPPGRYVVLSVSDDGEGMDDETMARIFEPFFTTKDPGKGTGLGLSTVFGIVKQSGGGIEVCSQPGQGAAFKLYFPRVEARAEAVVSLPREVQAAAGSETVLLAEDDDAVRRFVHETLTLHGYRVHETRNGHEAIRVLESGGEGIDLLITDIVMPGLGGAELLARVASVQPDLKILCISGHVDWATVHRAAIGSGTPFLHKPFTPEALAQKVREVLDGEERRQAA